MRPAAASRLTARLRDGGRRVLRSPWLHPLNDTGAIDDLLALADPRWSLSEIRAEVVGRETETADTVSFRLRPNRLWTGFRAGQHAMLTVEIDGVRHQRVYSLSSDPAQRRLLRLTVKRQANGRVSGWLHERLQIGDVLRLAPAEGDFAAPATGPVLLLSAGSGITPMRAVLHELWARAAAAAALDVVHVHVCRDAPDQIFAGELAALARDWPAFRFLPWHSAERGRPTVADLLSRVPDYAQREALLCGPAGFMADVESHWAERGLAARLRLERFGLAPRAAEDGAAAEVRCVRSERVFAAAAGEALLPAAERAGLTPAYGCRIGICRTCLCKKRSGSVENLVTGERSDEPGEWIRLCVSTPRSALELDL